MKMQLLPEVQEKFIKDLLLRIEEQQEKKQIDDYVFLCIGVDKLLGDCLGPLIGSKLKQMSISAQVYGNLEENIGYCQLEEYQKRMDRIFPKYLCYCN